MRVLDSIYKDLCLATAFVLSTICKMPNVDFLGDYQKGKRQERENRALNFHCVDHFALVLGSQ